MNKNHYLTPDKLNDLTPYLEFGIFSVAEIKTEIGALLSALPQTDSDFPDHWSDDEYFDLVFQFSKISGNFPPTKKELHEQLSKFPPEGIEVLRKYLSQVLAAVKSVGTYSGKGFDSTETVLLPLSWARRYDYLLTQRTLPVAWIQRIDASTF